MTTCVIEEVEFGQDVQRVWRRLLVDGEGLVASSDERHCRCTCTCNDSVTQYTGSYNNPGPSPLPPPG